MATVPDLKVRFSDLQTEILKSVQLLEKRIQDLFDHIPQIPALQSQPGVTQTATLSQSWSIPELVETLESKNKELEETMNEMEVEAEDTNRALDLEKAKVVMFTKEVDQLKQTIKNLKEKDLKTFDLSSMPHLELSFQMEETPTDCSSCESKTKNFLNEIDHYRINQTSLENTIQTLQSVQLRYLNQK